MIFRSMAEKRRVQYELANWLHPLFGVGRLRFAGRSDRFVAGPRRDLGHLPEKHAGGAITGDGTPHAVTISGTGS